MEEEILTLKNASQFSKISIYTLTKLIKENGLPAAHVGRGYKIIKSDLLDYIRSLNNKKQTTDKITKRKSWVSLNQKIESIGEYASQRQTDDEYSVLLGLKTNKTLSGCTTK